MKKKVFTLLLALVAIATTARAPNKINKNDYDALKLDMWNALGKLQN